MALRSCSGGYTKWREGVAQFGVLALVGNYSQCGSVYASLFDQIVHARAGSEHRHLEPVGALACYVERLCAYRSGGTYYRYVFYCLCHFKVNK